MSDGGGRSEPAAKLTKRVTTDVSIIEIASARTGPDVVPA